MKLAQATAWVIIWLLAPAAVWAQAPGIPASAPPPAAAPAASDPGQQLRQIMEQPLYQRWRLRQERLSSPPPDAGDSALVKAIKLVVDELGQWIRDVIHGIVKSVPAPSRSWSMGDPAMWLAVIRLLAWTLLAVVVILLAFLAYRVFQQAQPAWSRGRVLSRKQVRDALNDGQALALAAPEWLGEAQRLALQPDARAVYRALYLALLSGLHDAGKIDFRRNRTNWVYVNRFKGPQDQRGMFEKLTGMFDQIWYGQSPADAARIDQVRNDVTALIGKGNGDA